MPHYSPHANIAKQQQVPQQQGQYPSNANIQQPGYYATPEFYNNQMQNRGLASASSSSSSSTMSTFSNHQHPMIMGNGAYSAEMQHSYDQAKYMPQG